jgi:hypothetical protein
MTNIVKVVKRVSENIGIAMERQEAESKVFQILGTIDRYVNKIIILTLLGAGIVSAILFSAMMFGSLIVR